MAWMEQPIKDWREFATWVDGVASKGKRYMYRGQPGDYKNLKPKYLRALEQHGIRDAALAHKIEKELIDTFFRTAPLHLDETPIRALQDRPQLASVLLRWGIMQHYGAPTRVLDWTASPYVAVYFAVEKAPEAGGEVWCYSEEELEKRWAAAAKSEQVPLPLVAMPYEDYEKVRRLDARPIIHHFIHGTQTTRMAAQQGVFTVSTDVFSDQAKLLDDWLTDCNDKGALQRVLIPAEQKMVFLRRLRLMNITGASLFPGIDGVGKSVQEWADIKLSGQI